MFNAWTGAGVSTHPGLPPGGGREPVRKPVQSGAGESVSHLNHARRKVACLVLHRSCWSVSRFNADHFAACRPHSIQNEGVVRTFLSFMSKHGNCGRKSTHCASLTHVSRFFVGNNRRTCSRLVSSRLLSLTRPSQGSLGYVGAYFKRGGGKSDGCATFVRGDEARLVQQEDVTYMVQGHPVLDR